MGGYLGMDTRHVRLWLEYLLERVETHPRLLAPKRLRVLIFCLLCLDVGLSLATTVITARFFV